MGMQPTNVLHVLGKWNRDASKTEDHGLRGKSHYNRHLLLFMYNYVFKIPLLLFTKEMTTSGSQKPATLAWNFEDDVNFSAVCFHA